MFAKWPILAEKAFLRKVNAAWLSRSERHAYAYSTLRPPTFSGDSLASAVWLTVRNLWRWRDDFSSAPLRSRACRPMNSEWVACSKCGIDQGQDTCRTRRAGLV